MKIRGTAHHIGEKYLQLARDAQLSGDPVMAESYLQHAEHYFRLIATAQQAQQQAAYGYQRPPGEPESDDDGDDDFDSLPDRFASPSEQRAAQQPQQAAPQQPYQDRQSYNNNGGGQPYEARQQQNYDRNNQPQPQPHYDRPPQQGYDRGNQEPRGGQEARGYDNRRGGNGHQQDRGGQDRNNQERNNQDRIGQDRNGQDRGQGYQGGGQQQDRAQPDRAQQPDRAPQPDRGQQHDRQPRDYDNRNFRSRDRGPRDVRDGSREQRAAAQADEQPNVGLPAFITGPTRSLPEASAHEAEPERHVTEQAIPHEASPDAGEETPHLRPRRRRRPKGEFAGSEGETQPQPEETSAGD